MEHALRLRARAARDAVVSGALRGVDLIELIRSIPVLDRDAWVDELLDIEPPPPDAPDLPRGAVPYLPCGIDEILALVHDVPLGPTDDLVDIGAGLGRAAILAHLLSGARTSGIEIQAPLVHLARERCAALNVTAVSFVHANAADTPLDGSVFFLYAPCNGQLLARLLNGLQEVARRRPITVATVGLELDAPWLIPRSSSMATLALYLARVADPS